MSKAGAGQLGPDTPQNEEDDQDNDDDEDDRSDCHDLLFSCCRPHPRPYRFDVAPAPP